jgi:ketosteroid isomerase-like protein
MGTQNEELARRGYEALMRGDFDQLEELMAPDLTWHWWEPGPGDCHSRDEALAVIKERLSQNAIGELREVSDLGDGRVLVVTGLPPESEVSATDLGLPEGQDETANAVTIRDGKMIAMQDYRTKGEAMGALGGGHGGS